MAKTTKAKAKTTKAKAKTTKAKAKTTKAKAKTTKAKEFTEVSEAQIAVHWKEEDYYQPSEKFKAQANMRDKQILEKFGLANFPDCFKERSEEHTSELQSPYD